MYWILCGWGTDFDVCVICSITLKKSQTINSISVKSNNFPGEFQRRKKKEIETFNQIVRTWWKLVRFYLNQLKSRKKSQTHPFSSTEKTMSWSKIVGVTLLIAFNLNLSAGNQDSTYCIIVVTLNLPNFPICSNEKKMLSFLFTCLPAVAMGTPYT